ncbi:MAG: hypothetical protein QOC96_2277 [Acidobacteriota bacterium]|nr:hypothetical protein [Acidobacteriota bacterium]
MLKKIFVPLMLSVSCALLLTACGGSDSNNAATTNTTTSKTTTTTSTPTTTTTTTTSSPATTTSSPATTTTTTASSGDKVGVPECDEYLTKMEACLSKLPAVAKDQYEKSFEQTRTAWRNAASTPQGKAGLAQGCKAMTDQMKTSMKSYNCDF